ncbi:MAG: DUF58 domain-containing protein [Bacteroidota bacterium]
MEDFLRKLRKYEIRIRKAVAGHLQGDFHSVFKGAGLEFDDVRQYQYGDDVRSIDWNVSAKGHGTFVKTFREEKEQTVFFMLDVSASQDIGNTGQKKIDISKEIVGVLALSAIKEGSQVGLFCFSDRREQYIKPGKGMKFAYQIISSLHNLRAQSLKTSLNSAIFFVLNILRRRCVIILVSDFIDNEDYFQTLRPLARRHDLIVIHVHDSREVSFPKLGIIPLFDRERGRQVWINTSSGNFSRRLEQGYNENREKIQQFCRANQVNYLGIDTQTDFVPELIKLFKTRNRSHFKSA